MSTFITPEQRQRFPHEMRQILAGRDFQKIPDSEGKEVVYGKRVDRKGEPLTLRVYTTIDKRSGLPREKGSDAIRIALFGIDSDGNPKLIGADTRVHRTQNWKQNLAERLDGATEKLIGPKCSNGHRMALRSGPSGKFWGCTEYPRCEETRNYSG
jgi:hypothetical protein